MTIANRGATESAIFFNQIFLFYSGSMECPVTLYFFTILTGVAFEYLNLLVSSRVRCAAKLSAPLSQNAMLGFETNMTNQMKSRFSI
jgi:hypothetical protein